MKKILLLAVIAILLTALTSCDPEPIPPGPPPVNYAISTNIIGKGLVNPDKLSMINLGSNVTLKFTPETGYSLYSVKINGVKVEDIQPSSVEVSYTIHNINKNQNVEVVFVETDILIVSVKSTAEKPWMMTIWNSYKASDGSFLERLNLNEENKTDKYYFLYPSMSVVVLEKDGGIRNGSWSLKQSVITIDYHDYPMLELTPNKFTYKTQQVWSNHHDCFVFYTITLEREESLQK